MPPQRMVTLVLTLLLAGGAGATLVRAVLPPAGLTARYYSNTTFSGPPIVVGVDPTPATEVIASRTSGLVRFSAEWEGALAVHRPGRYTFALTSDDGSELWVDERRVVSNGGVHGPREARGEIELARGMHPIHVRCFQDGGWMTLQVRVAHRGGELEPLAPWWPI
jgi:hypothetical protein